MSAEETKTGPTRIRKPAPRHRDVVLGCIHERLIVLAETVSASDPNVERIHELLDELARSLRKDNGSE